MAAHLATEEAATLAEQLEEQEEGSLRAERAALASILDEILRIEFVTLCD